MGAGGSHKVAAALAREVLMCDVPASFSYEFFTLAGAKMSSSRGIGATAGELADLLPPELLRYLVLRVQPRKAVDFALDVAGVTRAFSEYERLWRGLSDSGPAQQQLFALSQPAPGDGTPPPPGYSPPFDTLVSVVQQPHIDLGEHMEAVGRTELSSVERRWIERKWQTAQSWSQRFSDMAANLTVVEDFQSEADRLTNHQRSFLSVASRLLSGLADWNAADIQGTLFDAARVVGIDPAQAFAAFYAVFFGGTEGPRAGSFLEFVGRQQACSRLGAVSYSYRDLVEATAMPRREWEQAVSAARSTGQSMSFLPVWVGSQADDPKASEESSGAFPDGLGVIESFLVDDKGRTAASRTVFERVDGVPAPGQDPNEAFHRDARSYLAGLLSVPESEVSIRRDSPFGPADDRGTMS